MSTPICCGKRATSYRRNYGRGGWEEGYRCKRCGAIRLPTGRTPDMRHMEAMPGIRAAGMAYFGETE